MNILQDSCLSPTTVPGPKSLIWSPETHLARKVTCCSRKMIIFAQVRAILGLPTDVKWFPAQDKHVGMSDTPGVELYIKQGPHTTEQQWVLYRHKVSLSPWQAALPGSHQPQLSLNYLLLVKSRTGHTKIAAMQDYLLSLSFRAV